MNACLGTFGDLEPQAKEAFSSQPTPYEWLDEILQRNYCACYKR